MTARARRVAAELAGLGIAVPSAAGIEQHPALIDQCDTDDVLVRATVDFVAELHAECDARRMDEVLIERARRRVA